MIGMIPFMKWRSDEKVWWGKGMTMPDIYLKETDVCIHSLSSKFQQWNRTYYLYAMLNSVFLNKPPAEIFCFKPGNMDRS